MAAVKVWELPPFPYDYVADVRRCYVVEANDRGEVRTMASSLAFFLAELDKDQIHALAKEIEEVKKARSRHSAGSSG